MLPAPTGVFNNVHYFPLPKRRLQSRPRIVTMSPARQVKGRMAVATALIAFRTEQQYGHIGRND